MLADYSTLRPTIAELRGAGITGVGRYIGWDSVPGYPSIGKNLTKAEAQTLTGAGISIFLAFEYTADAAAAGGGQGAGDGILAATQLRQLGAPAGVTVYFCCDWDVPDYVPTLPDTPVNARTKLGPITAYFTAIAATRPAYTIGVYGGYYVCKRVLDAGLASMAWQTTAWSGGQRDPRAVIYQTGQTILGGADVDIHETTSPDFGQWPRPAQQETHMIISTPPPGNWEGVIITLGKGTDGNIWTTTSTDGEHWTDPVKQ